MKKNTLFITSQNGQRILPHNGLEVSIDSRGQTHIGVYLPNGKLLEMAQYTSYQEAMAVVEEIRKSIEYESRRTYKLPNDSQFISTQLYKS